MAEYDYRQGSQAGLSMRRDTIAASRTFRQANVGMHKSVSELLDVHSNGKLLAVDVGDARKQIGDIFPQGRGLPEEYKRIYDSHFQK